MSTRRLSFTISARPGLDANPATRITLKVRHAAPVREEAILPAKVVEPIVVDDGLE
jgi:hypothetical protein